MNKLSYRRITIESIYFLIMYFLLFLFLFCFEKAYGKDCCDEDVRFCPGYQEPDKPDPPWPDPPPSSPAPTNEPTVISEPSRPDPTPTSGPSEPPGPVSVDETPSVSGPGPSSEGKEGREEGNRQPDCEIWGKWFWIFDKCLKWRNP